MPSGHPTRRDFLRIGGAAAASALLARVVGPVRCVEARTCRHAALVRAQAAGDRHPRHAEGARRDGLHGRGAREHLQHVGRQWRTHLDAAR